MDIAGSKRVLGPGGLVIIPPATLHQTRASLDQGCVRHCLHFDWLPDAGRQESPLWSWSDDQFKPKLVHPVPPAIVDRLPLFHDLTANRSLQDLIVMLFRLCRKHDPLAADVLAAVLRAVIDPAPLPQHVRDDSAAIHRLFRHIDARYADPLTHADFLDLSGLTSNRMCRLFRDLTGCRPMEYLARIRILHAQIMLKEEQTPLEEIARRVGLPNVTYFMRVFSREVGEPPGAYRRRTQRDQAQSDRKEGIVNS